MGPPREGGSSESLVKPCKVVLAMDPQCEHLVRDVASDLEGWTPTGPSLTHTLHSLIKSGTDISKYRFKNRRGNPDREAFQAGFSEKAWNLNTRHGQPTSCGVTADKCLKKENG